MSHTKKEFRTVRGYELLRQEDKALTPSMEDYLEMTCRLSRGKSYSRVGDLAEALNVQPPSASRMMQRLAKMGYVNYKKYGAIELTDKGKMLGEYLLKRHGTIEQFLSLIGVTEGLLEQTEKIEHNISEGTLERIRILVAFMKEHRQWKDDFNDYVKKC